jgi:hypothetical protein
MPFGLSNAPATFQAYINQALIGLVDVTCVVYLDDILIFSEDLNHHAGAVKEVLNRLYANLKKCVFTTDSVEFLGFIVGPKGITMDPARVATVNEWPPPRMVPIAVRGDPAPSPRLNRPLQQLLQSRV